MSNKKTGVELIAEERQRQIEKEGWTAEHDAKYLDEELPRAAATYAITEDIRRNYKADFVVGAALKMWPWDKKWFKPSPDNRIKELAKAGALIAAEIDRLQNL